MLRRVTSVCRQHRTPTTFPTLAFLRPFHPAPSRKPCPSKTSAAQKTNSFQPSPALIVAVHRLLAQQSASACLSEINKSQILHPSFIDRERARLLAENMAHSRTPHYATRILLLAHQLGCRFKQNAYECLAHHFSESNRWHLISPLVVTGKEHTGRTTVRLLNWLTRAHIELQNFALLSQTLPMFAKEELVPNRRTFHLLVSGHIRNHDIKSSREALKSMQQADIPIDATTYALVVTVYRSMGTDTQVENHAFQVLREVDDAAATAVLNSIMQMRLDAQDVAGALKILDILDQSPNALAAGGTTIKPRPSETPSLSRPVYADAATYSILMNYSAHRRDLPRVFRILDMMRTMGVKPGPETIISLIHAHFAVRDGYTPARLVADLCPCSTCQQLRGMFPVAETAQALPSFQGIKPTMSIFNALLKGVIVMRGLPGSLIILNLMNKHKFTPDATTVEIILSYLDKVERARPRTLLRVLKAFTSSDVAPTLRHLHILLRSVLRLEKYAIYGSGWDTTAAKFSATRTDNAKYPTGRISGHSELFDPTAGIELPNAKSSGASYRSLFRPLIKSLAVRRILSDRATIALRMKHESVVKGDMESASKVMETLLARGLHPNEYHYSALMEGYAQRGELAAAETVLASATNAGVKPNVVMYTILIVGYARQAQPNQAMRTFQQMVAAGIPPDVPAIDAITSAFFVVGAYGMARKVLRELWIYIQPFPDEMRGLPLKILARRFRALHSPNPRSFVSKQKRLILSLKVAKLVRLWQELEEGPKSSRRPSTFRKKYV